MALKSERRTSFLRGRGTSGAAAGPVSDFLKHSGRGARNDNPAPGTGINPGLDLYHDAETAEYASVLTGDGSLVLTIYQFDGSYLSLVAAMPGPLLGRLRSGGKVRLRLTADCTRPLTAFARVNLKTVEQSEMHHETVVISHGPRIVDVAMDGVRLPLDQLTAAWVDVIFSEPEMIEIAFSELSLEVINP